jgi:chloramphenicol 3-O-phosphotransferase
MLSSKRYSSLYLTLVFCILVLSNCSAGTIILLNGTSSAGKSSIAQELTNMLTAHTVASISYDEVLGRVLRTMAKEKGYSCTENQSLNDLCKMLPDGALDRVEFGHRIDSMLHDEIRKLVEIHKFVIVDAATEDQEDYAIRMQQLAGLNVFHILVYCNPEKLMEHVSKRNLSDNKDEHRTIVNPFAQFYSIYKPAQSNEHCIDTLDIKKTNALLGVVLEKAQPMLNDEEKAEATQLLLKNFVQKFKCDEQATIKINPFFTYDLLVDTSTVSAEACAQQIVKKLEQQGSMNMVARA